METLEHLYAHAIDEHELIHASNPYGCNQYGHEWRAKHGQNTGKSTKDDIDREIDDYMKLSPEKKKHQRDQLEQKANELLQKNRERIKRVAQSQGRTPQEIEEHLNKYYPRTVQ